MPTEAELLENYKNELRNLINANIDASSTNPLVEQELNFAGDFVEQNSPVNDIYEYEDILNENLNELNTTEAQPTDTRNTTESNNTGQSTGY
tara:strand:+ start:52 stop:327 length:276 start_codon:yes stop_codon:yes gene_type:complete